VWPHGGPISMRPRALRVCVFAGGKEGDAGVAAAAAAVAAADDQQCKSPAAAGDVPVLRGRYSRPISVTHDGKVLQGDPDGMPPVAD